MQPIRSWRRRVTCAAALLAAGALTACGGSSSGSANSSGSAAGGGKGDTLTVAVVFPVTTLDPAKVGTDPTGIMTTQLAYDPLIYSDAKGEKLPGLATSWKYVGEGNKQLEVTLRSGAKFADGTPVTAQAVADSINYFVKNTTNPAVPATLGGAKATGDLAVQIDAPMSNPELPLLLSNLLAGSIISPAGLKAPDKLATETYGAGPYMLDAAQTTSGSRYTYVPNPNYYDPKRIHWNKVVFLQMQSGAAALNALRSGQADVAVPVDANDAPAAESAGLTITHAPSVAVNVVLGDRNGTLAPALKDVRVRQALNYAIDRASIAKALFGEYATPLDQLQLPGTDGYVSSMADHYAYDPAKAKQLLAQAGYPNGFSMPGLAVNVAGADKVAEAVFANWAKVGVKVDSKTEAPGQFYPDAVTKKYAVLAQVYGSLPTFFTSASFLRPIPSAFNPWAIPDPEVDKLLAQGDAAPDTERPKIYQDAMTKAIENADVAPVLAFDAIVGSSKKVQGIEVSAVKNTPDLSLITPAG